MAKDNFDACITVSLEYEGGYSSIRSDPGNWTGGKVGKGQLKGTKYGIAASSHPTLDIKNLSVAQAKDIYRAEYWYKVSGDALPYGVDLATNDYGINSGPSRSIRDLQRAVAVTADGAIGPQTQKAIILAGGKETIQKLCARRLGFLKGLTSWKTFGRGWSSRVANVEAKAVSMWLAKGGKLTPEHKDELQSEADKAQDKASTQGKSAGTVAGSGTAVGGGGAVATGEINWIVVAVIALALVGAIVLVIKSRQNKERAAAYQAAAA